MNAETLTFREVLDATPNTELAVSAPTTVDLTTINLTDVALSKFGKWREKTASARKTLTGVQHDLSTQAKIDDAKSLRQRLINAPLAEARKVSKAVKSKLTEVSSEVGAELTKIEAEYGEVAKLITPQIEAREAEIAEEKRIAAEKEAERVAAIQARIDAITASVVRAQAPEMTAERILKGIGLIEAIAIDDSFAEFKAEAEGAKTTTLAAMRNLAAIAKAREDEAARVEAQRLENERIAAEQKAEADRLAAERAEFERQKAELVAAQAEAEERARISQQNAEREQREAQERAAAEALRAEEEATQARAAEESRLEREAKAKEVEAICEATRQEIADVLGLPAAAPAVATAPVAAASVVAARTIHPAAQALRNETPTLALGEICKRLGFTVTDGLLDQLGYPAEAVIKGAKLRRQSQFGDICNALIRHIECAAADAVLAA